MSNGKKFVESVRKASNRMKEQKEGWAKKAVDCISKVKKPIQRYYDRTMATGLVVQNILDVIDEITQSDGLKNQASTLVSNVIQDSANRLQEFANLLEASLKNEKIAKAVQKATKAMDDFDAKYPYKVKKMDVQGN